MKKIQELIGKEATERLKERYGQLVDWTFVEEQGPQIFKMQFQIFDYKRTSARPTPIMIERVMGVGLAEIEQALYSILNFDGRNMGHGFHFNNDLPKNGIYMHREIYKKLMESERESMRKIEERLGQLDKQKGAILG
jgi:hypothetical protein